MDDLIAFFTARLDEEEAMLDASDAADSLHRWLDGDQTTIDLVDRFADSERLHRDIAAKREVLRMHGVGRSMPSVPTPALSRLVLERVIQVMATAWNDHPDYQARWAITNDPPIATAT